MPRMMTLSFSDFEDSPNPKTVPVATHEELLAFANRVREVGGAAPLDALLPATPDEDRACLIAKAVNFASSVRTYKSKASFPSCDCHEDGSWVWCMVPQATDFKPGDVERIANKLGLKFAQFVVTGRPGGFVTMDAIILPPEIGNAARAFDLGAAFSDLVAG